MSNLTAIKAVSSNKITVFFLGIILLAISSKIAIPFYPVPMTLQTLVIYLIAGSMGNNRLLLNNFIPSYRVAWCTDFCCWRWPSLHSISDIWVSLRDGHIFFLHSISFKQYPQKRYIWHHAFSSYRCHHNICLWSCASFCFYRA